MEPSYDNLGGPFVGTLQYHIRGHNKHENVNILQNGANLMEVIKMIGEEKDRQMNDDPFIVCDLGEVIKRYNRMTTLMPRIRPYYAVKVNPSHCIAQLLFDLGTGFDCSSMNEIKKVRCYGATSDDVIFANAVKQPSHLRYCQKIRYPYTTFDSKEEFMKIMKAYPEAKPLIRIKAETGKDEDGMAEKFGAFVKDAKNIVLFAKEMGISLAGVSFHIGWATHHRASVFHSTIDDAFEIAKDITSDPEEEIIVDIGGGYGGVKEIDDAEFEDVCAAIRLAMADNLRKWTGRKIKLMCEPGTYFASACMTLVCMTLSKKLTTTHGKRFEYFLNDGVHGSLSNYCFGATELFPQLLRKKHMNGVTTPTYETTLWGPTCDGYDVIKRGIMLPEMEIGERIAFHSIGEYNLSTSTNFCGFDGPRIIYVAEERYKEYFEKSRTL